MSRIDRLREYSKPMKGPHGASRDEENLDYWADRASDNSKIAPRASDGEINLPATGKRQQLRDTESNPRTSRKIDARMAGRDDINNVGSSFMRGVRRDG